eukprot:TRINITY_DN5146_c4_g1_i1.p1 TRINITY_DN5146_c4_g1~~TRINITY_DN5146_c4_g1_i1.p1  ORF type:complete len:405 (+),score=64.76 TRINITY_DN5146_c4_g1_i1:164-1378(+)
MANGGEGKSEVMNNFGTDGRGGYAHEDPRRNASSWDAESIRFKQHESIHFKQHPSDWYKGGGGHCGDAGNTGEYCAAWGFCSSEACGHTKGKGSTQYRGQFSGEKTDASVSSKCDPWEDVEIPTHERFSGLTEAIVNALRPLTWPEGRWTPARFVPKVAWHIEKIGDIFSREERLSKKGDVVQALGVLEDFVETLLEQMPTACAERDLVSEVNLAPPITLVAFSIFHDCRLFCRVLAPMLQNYIEDAISRFCGTRRISQAVWDTVASSELPEKYFKKCHNHLMKSYDVTHSSTTFGLSQASTPELGLLQDFAKGWIEDFVERSWDVLENGIGSHEDQASFVTALFQRLAHPEICCFPDDLVVASIRPVLDNWPFIPMTVNEIFIKMEADTIAKKRKVDCTSAIT